MSHVLDGGLTAAVVRLIVLFLGRKDLFYLDIVGVVWLLVLAATVAVGVCNVFHKKGLCFCYQ